MKIFALGGYGAVGLPSAKLLAESDLVSEIALAGRNLEHAEQAAKELGDKAKAVQVDGADKKQLASLMEGYDIIVNAASNQVALPSLQAAVLTGAHYCDVGYGLDFINQMQELEDEARDADITAIICNGISPCITNLMGVHAASQLDETEQLQGGRFWVFQFQGGRTLTPQQWLKNPSESLAVLHKFKDFLEWTIEFAQQSESRMVRAYQDGQWVDKDPLISGLKAPLPQGGMVTAYPYGCYDQLWESLPTDLAKAPPVQIWFSPFPPQLSELFREQVLRAVAGNIDPASAVKSFFETVESDPDRWLTLTDDIVPFSPDWVTAVGKKEGRAARYNCWLTPAIWTERAAWLLTSVPLVVAALRILRGEVQERGVMTAETAFEPLPFINEVASLTPDPPPDGKLLGESFEWLE